MRFAGNESVFITVVIKCRKRAMAKGVKFGRPPSLTPHQRREAMERLAEGAGQADLARSYGVSQATISRLRAPSPFAENAVAVDV